MQWQSLTFKVFLLLGLSTSLTDARLILTPVTSPWIKTIPWKTTHPSQNARVDLISKPTAQGGLFSPQTGDMPWKPSRLTSTTDFQEKLGPDAYPLSQGSAISGVFFSMPLFSTWKIYFPFLGSFFSYDYPNKERWRAHSAATLMPRHQLHYHCCL